MKCGHTTVARAVARIPGRRLGILCQHAKDGQGRRPQRPVATGKIVDGSAHRNVHSICSCHLTGRRLLRNIAPESLRPCWIWPLGLANAGDPSATRSRCEARPTPAVRSFYEGLEALEPLVGSATTAEPWEPWRPNTTTPTAPAVRAPISRALRNQIYARDRFTCQNQKCGAKKGERGVQLVIDHKKPVKRGGTNDPSNLQTLCSLCNSKKGAKNTGHGDRARDTPDE